MDCSPSSVVEAILPLTEKIEVELVLVARPAYRKGYWMIAASCFAYGQL